MKAKQLISAEEYDFLINASNATMSQIEQLTGEFSPEQRQRVAGLCLTLTGEVLLRHGPRLQNHMKGMNNAFCRFAASRRALRVADHPEEPELPVLQSLEDEVEGEAPVEGRDPGPAAGPVD